MPQGGDLLSEPMLLAETHVGSEAADGRGEWSAGSSLTGSVGHGPGSA